MNIIVKGYHILWFGFSSSTLGIIFQSAFFWVSACLFKQLFDLIYIRNIALGENIAKWILSNGAFHFFQCKFLCVLLCWHFVHLLLISAINICYTHLHYSTRKYRYLEEIRIFVRNIYGF